MGFMAEKELQVCQASHAWCLPLLASQAAVSVTWDAKTSPVSCYILCADPKWGLRLLRNGLKSIQIYCHGLNSYMEKPLFRAIFPTLLLYAVPFTFLVAVVDQLQETMACQFRYLVQHMVFGDSSFLSIILIVFMFWGLYFSSGFVLIMYFCWF